MDYMEVGKHIKEKRIEKGLRQEDLAEKTNLSVSYIGMIERGEKMPILKTFVIILNALDASADDILSSVLHKGYIVRMSQYTERIGKLKLEDQKRIFEVIDTMLKNT